MARPTALSDPVLYEKVIEQLALGYPQTLIAESLGVHENTLSGWKKRKDFSRDLALKTAEVAAEPILQVKKTNPLAWLERHNKLREAFAPPKQEVKQEVTGSIEVLLKEIDGKGIPKPGG